MATSTRRGSEETAASPAPHSASHSFKDAEDGVDTKEKALSDGAPSDEEAPVYPTGIPLALIAFGLILTVFTVSLDQTIIASPLPQITDEFNALSDVGFYSSAYLMSMTALQPMFGRIYGLAKKKYVFIAALVIFEVGSLICALAQDSGTFIAGRAIAGLGCAGLYIGCLLIFSVISPLEKQAVWTGFIGVGYGAGAVIGPLIGGAISSNTTWRWCFWINLPIGGIAIAIVFFFAHTPPPPKQDRWQIIKNLDYIGTILLLGSVISILLALQNGGAKWAWDDSKTIGCIVGFGLMQIAFWIVQVWAGENATVPIRILNQRTIIAGCIVNFCTASCYFTELYFVPIYFQSVRGSSAIRSGVQTLAFIIPVIVGTIFAGGAVTKVGYVTPFLAFGCLTSCIGAGLLYRFHPDTSEGYWIGAQVLAGWGVGMAFQLPFVASQAVYSGIDAGIASSIVIFAQILGGCLMVSVAQAIFQNEWASNLLQYSDLDRAHILAKGVTGFREFLSGQQLLEAAAAASDAIDKTFVIPIATAALSFFVAWAVEWRSIKGQATAVAAA